MSRKQMIVKIRRDIGREVRPEAERIDGKTYWFRFGWTTDEDDPYPGEDAWVADDPEYPQGDADLVWISSGDLTSP